MQTSMLSRRSILSSALLAPMVPALPAAAEAAQPSSLGFFAAVVRAKATDAAYRASGRVSMQNQAAGLPSSVEWREHRAALRAEREAARVDLRALTPATEAEARALIDYYAGRAEVGGTKAAIRIARRHLREIFARPGACGSQSDLPPPLTADPIFAAIEAVKRTDAEFTALLEGLDEEDASAVRRADEAADRASDALKALYATVPATAAGLHALIRHHAEDAEIHDQGLGCCGTLNLAHLARIVAQNAPS